MTKKADPTQYVIHAANAWVDSSWPSIGALQLTTRIEERKRYNRDEAVSICELLDRMGVGPIEVTSITEVVTPVVLADFIPAPEPAAASDEGDIPL